jgi:hypothetical protein
MPKKENPKFTDETGMIVTSRVPNEMYAKILEDCEENDRNISQVIRRALRFYFEREE